MTPSYKVHLSELFGTKLEQELNVKNKHMIPALSCFGKGKTVETFKRSVVARSLKGRERVKNKQVQHRKFLGQ